MQAQPALLKFSEAEQSRGDRLLKIALETDRIEGYSEPHSILIARLATGLGERMGMHGIELTSLKFASLIHDIGERTMKRNYMLHSYQLTWEETLDLWRHPILGEQAAAELGLSRLTQLLVRWHHEWWNGHGYPDSLQGKAIPMAARILRVVDSYCSLISNRPHRMRFAPSEAEQIISDLAGIEFDPLVVKIMLELLGEKQRIRQPEVRGIEPEPEIYHTPTPQESQPIVGAPEAEHLETVLPKREYIEPDPERSPINKNQESQGVINEPKTMPIEYAPAGKEFVEPEAISIELAPPGQEFIEPEPELYSIPTYQKPRSSEIEPREADKQTLEYLEDVPVFEEHLSTSDDPHPVDPHLPDESEAIGSKNELTRSARESSPEYIEEESPGDIGTRTPDEEKVELPTSKSEG
jgi:HD domain